MKSFLGVLSCFVIYTISKFYSYDSHQRFFTNSYNIEEIFFSSLEAGIVYMVYVFDFKHWDPNRPMSSSNANVLISAPGIDAVEVQVPSDAESEHR